MIRALWVSASVVLLATVALFQAPPGQADPVGTLFRTALAAGVLVFLGRLVGTAAHRRPPRALATRVVVLIFVTVAIEVLAIGFSPNWSVALAVWYLALFAAGALLNRWCDAPERYAVLVAAFIVVSSSLILMVIAAASPRAPADLTSSAVLVSLWPNVARIAGHPVEAAWTWLAWRVLDRLRRPEARRPKTFARAAAKPPQPRKPV
jgi:MFS family permease